MQNFRQPSVMKHMFSMAPKAKLPRSSFDLSSGNKTNFDAGYLIPTYLQEILPGDTVNLKCTNFTRMATPLYPLMDNLYIDHFWFWVPHRLVFDNFVKLMGEQENPGDSIDYTIPQISNSGFTVVEGDIGDHMGLPPGDYNNTFISAIPFRAYNLIYNEWFRDENLIDSLTVDKSDTASPYSDFELKRRGKRYDYFTGCLPFPQKGPDVSLPLGSTAPLTATQAAITGMGASQTSGWSTGPITSFETDASSSQNYAGWKTTSTGSTFYVEEDPDNSGYPNIRADLNGIEADLSNATAANINDMRLAIATQHFYEIDARSGTRFTEINQAHWGVENPDLRLQRPELLAVRSTPIRSQAVSSTTSVGSGVGASGVAVPLGQPGATMTGVAESSFTKSFLENGYIIGLTSVRADLTYSQGIDRHWSRQDRFDFPFPTFAHLGEQSVLNKEIFIQDTGPNGADDEVFGFQERYAEMRHQTSKLSNQMRPTSNQTLAAWNLSQEFANLPVLSEAFINERPPVDRVIAVQDEPQFVSDFYFDVKCARVLPTYSIPGLNRF